MAARVPQPDAAYLQKAKGKRRGARHIATQSAPCRAPCWNTHRTGYIMLPNLCILIKEKYSGKPWKLSRRQFANFLILFLLRQTEWKTFIFQSLHFCALTRILVCLWKYNSFSCPFPALRTSVQIWAILSERNPERTEKLRCSMKRSDFQRRSRPPPTLLLSCCWSVHQAANLYQQQ